MLVPHPARLTRRTGSFTPSGVRPAPGTAGPARLLAAYAGLPLVHSGPAVRLALAPGFGPEEYALDVTPGGALLTASTEAGLLAGVQTVRQLLPRLPCLHVRDAPRLPWRGVLLDVARHFMPPEFLRQFVDLLALHKFNVLQLHLTDDQGWRIEIGGWPRLTEVGAWRAESMVGPAGSAVFDGVPHGGFYPQRQLRDLVAFAAARGVTIVPEIDVPGHVRAALAAYPELGNRPGTPLPVWTEWGISPDILGVHDEALAFCRDVFTQVADIFPARHLHIGGDECPAAQWAANPLARDKAARLGLRDTAELHPWFLGELHRFLAGLGRQAVCWDETGHAAGRLPPDMVVTAWRDAAHGALAVARGHRVVMAPHTSTYFDYRQSDEPGEPPRTDVTTLEDVYRFDPLEGGLPVSDGTRPGVLGTQAQLWTEHAPTPGHVRRLAFPRLCALAERAWSPPGRSYADFRERLTGHLERLRALDALPKERIRFAGALGVPGKTVP